MRLKSIELSGFKSFAKKTTLQFASRVTSIVGPNGSGKSNIAESFRFVLGEQSMKSMRGRKGEDMIWNGSPIVPRAGRASVKLIFDNTERKLGLDFDEVSIERVVHRDGVNEYSLNGSQVRLRDIAEILAGANIGASSHHIISQGEADRILSASSKERREMIEDALGLTAYLYKREEAQRKLEKTAENMREVEAMRRELVPHLKFLSAQVKKIEEAQKLREDLKDKYLEYVKRESVYLAVSEEELKEEKSTPQKERHTLDARIEHLRTELSKKKNDAGSKELMALEAQGRAVSTKREGIGRELGRIEGELAAHERLSHEVEGSVSSKEAREFAEHIEREITHALEGENVKEKIQKLLSHVKMFIQKLTHTSGTSHSLEELHTKKRTLEKELSELEKEEAHIQKSVEHLRQSIEESKDASHEAERELFQAMTRRSELEAILVGLRGREDILNREREALKAELGEAAVLVGRDIASYEEYVVRDSSGNAVSHAEMVDEERLRQEERRKKLERMKIRLEEVGAGNSAEVLKEHKETTERDEFLARELGDLAISSEKLHELIDELTQTLESRFVNGIDTINTEFNSFFKLMFGGGSATLAIVKEKKLKRILPTDELAMEEDLEGSPRRDDNESDEEIEEGIEITISLPHKRVKGLHMLSGGERALTSIALIFAMSQVNPPPFLILDETDAALDEANSRRYGDMIENLSRKSQLILITHNRETMARAGILYGITMGSDGVSKLLSVNFEQAAAVAK